MVTKKQYEDWFTYLQTQYSNRSIYVWGAQGQGYPKVNESWIRSKESGKHRKNALATYSKSVKAGFEKKLRAFDCSGLGMYYFQNQERIFSRDMTANGLLRKCKKISKSELKKGDFVFRTYKSGSKKGRAYHIGYVVDEKLYVIEAKGRAYGVVKKKFNSSYWNVCARPEFFKWYIEQNEADAPFEGFDRTLSKGKVGEDVRELQMILNLAGADPKLAEDGDFGSKTQVALKDFQQLNEIKADGIATEVTFNMLERFTQETFDGEEPTEFTRLLKVGTKGEDVEQLQKLLNRQGARPKLDTDGIFGPKTAVALKEFQRKNDLADDAIFGKNTAEKLKVIFR